MIHALLCKQPDKSAANRIAMLSSGEQAESQVLDFIKN